MTTDSGQLDVGAWGLLCGVEGRQIVMIGGTPCGPISARKATKRVPRELLLDDNHVAEVYDNGRNVDEIVEREDGSWRVKLVPLCSPYSRTVLGVQAIVTRSEDDLPAMPLVGIWEWVIDRKDDGQPGSRRYTYWDENLFALYDMDPAIAQYHQGYWEAGEWANQLIEPTDQMRVGVSIRDGVQDGLNGVVEKVRCLTYHVVTGYGQPGSERGRRHLRLVGVIPRIQPQDEYILLQGFSYEVPEDFHDIAFEQDANAARVDDVLRGVMELARDPMVVVDPQTLNVLMTSAAWRKQSFGSVDSLQQLDLLNIDEVAETVRQAATKTSMPREMVAQRCDERGELVTSRITVLGVQSGLRSDNAVIRLDYDPSGASDSPGI
ncbi:hypothetical protein [Kocuria palustris]|uniref:hypothetical protein n=1 Tax=Kocuria palustris TaxID=71999 RepID=UPI002431B626|nr:hypothetical protein [Kocuria palustris]